jgi:hypothetical protein
VAGRGSVPGSPLIRAKSQPRSATTVISLSCSRNCGWRALGVQVLFGFLLVRAINESGHATAPISVSVHGTVTGVRGGGEVSEGLWRMSLETIDGWTLRATADAEAD